MSATTVALVVLLLWVFFTAFRVLPSPLHSWAAAQAAGIDLSLTALIRMSFRKVDSRRIVFPVVRAGKAGIRLPIELVEAHELSGGNADRVVDALILADQTGLPLTFVSLAEIDLAGVDPIETVQTLLAKRAAGSIAAPLNP